MICVRKALKTKERIDFFINVSKKYHDPGILDFLKVIGKIATMTPMRGLEKYLPPIHSEPPNSLTNDYQYCTEYSIIKAIDDNTNNQRKTCRDELDKREWKPI